mmetsp:Transcript_81428/g.226812  ORF Transcript_81428/g.226812 Transcript_81428/m.226812 type:complete len:326 (-) Transcript_81428:42-1019(-)
MASRRGHARAGSGKRGSKSDASRRLTCRSDHGTSASAPRTRPSSFDVDPYEKWSAPLDVALGSTEAPLDPTTCPSQRAAHAAYFGGLSHVRLPLPWPVVTTPSGPRASGAAANNARAPAQVQAWDHGEVATSSAELTMEPRAAVHHRPASARACRGHCATPRQDWDLAYDPTRSRGPAYSFSVSSTHRLDTASASAASLAPVRVPVVPPGPSFPKAARGVHQLEEHAAAHAGEPGPHDTAFATGAPEAPPHATEPSPLSPCTVEPGIAPPRANSASRHASFASQARAPTMSDTEVSARRHLQSALDALRTDSAQYPAAWPVARTC